MFYYIKLVNSFADFIIFEKYGLIKNDEEKNKLIKEIDELINYLSQSQEIKKYVRDQLNHNSMDNVMVKRDFYLDGEKYCHLNYSNEHIIVITNFSKPLNNYNYLLKIENIEAREEFCTRLLKFIGFTEYNDPNLLDLDCLIDAKIYPYELHNNKNNKWSIIYINHQI